MQSAPSSRARTVPEARPSTDIDERAGLSATLREALSAHPSSAKADTASPLAGFWLDKHSGLRRQSEALGAAGARWRERDGSDSGDPEGLAAATLPRLQRWLGELDGHHRIEDARYFPAYRRAAPGLAAGFDLLDADHGLLDADLVAIARQDAGDSRAAASAFSTTLARTHRRLVRHLVRHLEEEEDLIIPLLFRDRPEPGGGVSAARGSRGALTSAPRGRPVAP